MSVAPDMRCSMKHGVQHQTWYLATDMSVASNMSIAPDMGCNSEYGIYPMPAATNTADCYSLSQVDIGRLLL
ncbi:hypothetical protein [Bacteroides pyogenes]|uniref:hypothetical protein n=1 Tax=Bacteroides pyogenes TaxID=310300 RepID=UPI0011E43F86|nr:hypothetical protein [Bacteroides pyogenes]MCE9106610.1 hypothetical protein [Bacteroides pyogenes]TYK35313.1 hypothetical protein FNJ61_10055 [Bacteroides pyogenes]